MFCPKCGARNEDSASSCAACGEPLQGGPATPPRAGEARPVNPHLVEAIVVTVCCCMPFGIPAIVYAAMSKGRLHAGDVGGARQNAQTAMTWVWVAAGVGLVAWLLYVLYFVFVVGMAGGLGRF